uniref:Uncharacterized protein n=1 Tax=Sorghum bicolor TaxID=4558 RepID=C6JS23_SORBI
MADRRAAEAELDARDGSIHEAMEQQSINEMLARFVVDSHTRSRPKGANLEDRIPTDVDDDPLASE